MCVQVCLCAYCYINTAAVGIDEEGEEERPCCREKLSTKALSGSLSSTLTQPNIPGLNTHTQIYMPLHGHTDSSDAGRKTWGSRGQTLHTDVRDLFIQASRPMQTSIQMNSVYDTP